MDNRLTMMEQNAFSNDKEQLRNDVLVDAYDCFFTYGMLTFDSSLDPSLMFMSSELVAALVEAPEERDDWLSMMKKDALQMLPYHECKRMRQMIREDEMRAFREEEPEHRKQEITFELLDAQGKLRKMYGWLSCRQMPGAAERNGYTVLFLESPQAPKPEMDYEEMKEEHLVIRTFGYFDVFVDGVPIAFSSAKAKELLAILVNCRGGYISTREAATILWPGEEVNQTLLARYRKVVLRLKSTLEEYQIEDIITSEWKQRRLHVEKVKCDLYDYLSGEPQYRSLFSGAYMLNYHWAEEVRKTL